jgi:hypothetical protein
MITLLEEGPRLTTDYHPTAAYQLLPCGLLALAGLLLVAALSSSSPAPSRIQEQGASMCELDPTRSEDTPRKVFVPLPREPTTLESMEDFFWRAPRPESDLAHLNPPTGAYSTLGDPPPRSAPPPPPGLKWLYLSGMLAAFVSMVVFARSSMSVRGEIDRVAGMLRVTERWLFLSLRKDFPLLELDQFQADEGTVYALSTGGDRIWLGATGEDEARAIASHLCIAARS